MPFNVPPLKPLLFHLTPILTLDKTPDMAFLERLNNDLIKFIEQQQMYFVATAAQTGRINVSPKGLESFRVQDKEHVLWLNYTGSGNETAAHLKEQNRMTIMFCSFTEKPLILRLYGKVKSYHSFDSEWPELLNLFKEQTGARNIFLLEIESVQTSCGYGVPLYEFENARPTLTSFMESKGEKGLIEYQKLKNTTSIDGLDTGLFPEEG